MSLAKQVAPPEISDEDLYPSGDGKPMAETPIHVWAIILLLEAFQDFLADQQDTYIGGNMFWYWKEGDPKSRRAPDVMVIKGVGRRERRSFFSWKEGGAVPNVIVEVPSEKKWRHDVHTKRKQYEKLGVREYFLFDPEAIHLTPPLQGFRLNDEGIYEALKHDANGCLECQELGLLLKAEGRLLRLIDKQTGLPVLTRQERAEWEKQQAEVQKQRAEDQRQQADAERQRADAERQQANAERQQANAERQRADAERQRADALEREVARLKALFEKNGPTSSAKPTN